ncbi:MAG TPA: hypothetical protein VFF06_27145 [Polyangia bacterium]|nr:hypothetical protein [Polyangia bacterium]
MRPPVRAAALAAGLACLTLAGCPTPDPNGGLTTTQQPDQFLDYNQFVCTVEPVLIRRCSYLACHGNPDHALRVYSAGKLRLGDISTRAARDAALTADEVERNFQSASGVIYASSAQARQTPIPTQVPLLAKPLAARAGGSEHHGIGVFPVFPATSLDQDAEWQALVNWVGGAKQPTPVDADCMTVFTTMGLTPR